MIEQAPQAVAQQALDDLVARLTSTRFARLPPSEGWERGTNPDVLARLVQTWRTDYDWRAHEARVLALPWESAGTGQAAVRVVHQRAASPHGPAVVLLHGWPDSVLRFERLLPLLKDVHVVVPALPGFPFSHSSQDRGVSVARMGALVGDAMQALGYERYVVSGGDVGADVAEQLSVLRPKAVAALHLTNISPLHAVFADRATLAPDDLRYLDLVAAWQRKEGGYIAEQSSKPHTLAPGLADSPAGLAAWLVEKLAGWSHQPFSDDELLTWISVYWFSETIGTSFAPYAEFAKPVDFVRTPTVLSTFAHDTKPVPRSFASRFVNVVEFLNHDQGGHFAAWEQPERYAEDLRRAISIANG